MRIAKQPSSPPVIVFQLRIKDKGIIGHETLGGEAVQMPEKEAKCRRGLLAQTFDSVDVIARQEIESHARTQDGNRRMTQKSGRLEGSNERRNRIHERRRQLTANREAVGRKRGST